MKFVSVGQSGRRCCLDDRAGAAGISLSEIRRWPVACLRGRKTAAFSARSGREQTKKRKGQ